ncbi:MAG: anti-sigma factor family protein [Gammaproteobacteria bacterium]
MKQLHANPYSSHREISLLLPWYVNKTLSGAEMNRVEHHLKVCLTCRRELATLHKLAAAVRQEGSIDTAAQASFSLLKKRIHNPDAADREQAPRVIASPVQRLGYGKIRRLPRTALALAAVLLLSVLIPRFTDTGGLRINEYRTLSDAETPATGSNTVRVIFSNDTGRPKINEILASVHGRVVDGPTAQGVYTVALQNEPASTTVLNRVASLRDSPHVIFAEPAYALLSSVHADKDVKQ